MSAVPQIDPGLAGARPLLRRVSPPGQSRLARGENQLWLCGGALVLCVLMITGLLALVFGQGVATFWPAPLVQVRLHDGSTLLGEPTRTETFAPSPAVLDALAPEVRAAAVPQLAEDGTTERVLLRTGNFDLTGQHFAWVPDYLVAERTRPEAAVLVERRAWGRFVGFPVAYRTGTTVRADEPTKVLAAFAADHDSVLARFEEIEHLRRHDLGRLGERENDARLAVRRAELDHGAGSPEQRQAQADYERTQVEVAERAEVLTARIRELEDENARHVLVLRSIDGREVELPAENVVRAYHPNRLSLLDEVGVYLSRWGEFLTAEPRESNSEGGVYPAIFGTVLMTLLMTLCVVPFGVLAALYLREYARAGVVISAVRIAVNNLAGVPSIVFGVFGLGFFCYVLGGSIDALFYPERLPSPTFGKGALVWASLTLALLTLPVVIVATEEALAAVPGSMREGSYACGASKWQTIRRIVLPRAMPGIMTGTILAMARGAGEVAPLMLVGAVKLAPELPMDGDAPYLHGSRSFMHLGFHIYDLGFQSQNSEASKPMVFTTTLLLIAIITLLNVVAIRLRTRMRARFVGAQF
ncbi:MAG: phosphate ABC transporter permease PstA [Planctomycetota bacterium]